MSAPDEDGDLKQSAGLILLGDSVLGSRYGDDDKAVSELLTRDYEQHIGLCARASRKLCTALRAGSGADADAMA